MTAPLVHIHDLMPPRRPLERPIQNLAAPYLDANAPGPVVSRAMVWRLMTFVPAIVTTLILGAVFLGWFRSGGLLVTEIVLTALVTLTFFWIALSVATATVGILTFAFSRRLIGPARPASPLDVALLVPVYNENPSDVFGNAQAMLEDLDRVGGTAHRFTLFVLSDTRDEEIAVQERQAMAELRAAFPGLLGRIGGIHYRRRPDNIDQKTGNLSDWIENWGGGHEAMLVLDADSLMSGEAILSLADELSADPQAGLIQSFPQVIGARSLYGWLQQFSSNIYGALLSEGLARWTDREGNFWGHNAIIRTAAFAACAGLPHVRSLRSRKATILSHDFVEASLLRRAGWAVRFLPRIKGSYEEAPQTLIDYIIRDRRWCSGNLQHLRLLRSSGFHTVSRFHLLNGAVAYLMSPAWFVLLVFWALLGNGKNSILTYFSTANPEFPLWPVMSSTGGIYMLGFMYAMLLMPKVMGLLALRATGVRPHLMGGRLRFAFAVVAEVLLSMAYAPVMMVQQTLAVARVAVGIRTAWKPQRRGTQNYPLGTVVQFHFLETVVGTALMTGIVMGAVSPWLLPIAASLALAVPLSLMSGITVSGWAWTQSALRVPGAGGAQPVIGSATAHRARMEQVLNARAVEVAAE